VKKLGTLRQTKQGGTSEVLFMLGKKALVGMNESNTESKGNSAIV
jgi:hypothetical protein